MTAAVCRHWVGSDTSGHICGVVLAEGQPLCDKHHQVALTRATKLVETRREKAARADAAWRARNAGRLPQWRVQLERAEAEYSRRTSSVVSDRAAVGGAMHPCSSLSDANVARVVELEKIIARLRANIERAKAVSS